MATYELYLGDGEHLLPGTLQELYHTLFYTASSDRNFYIKDDKAFTEDNVLVYNIFVYKIPKNMNPDAIRTYFSQFGEVRKVRLVSDKKRSRRAAPKVGFVNFVDPLVAAKVLEKGFHQFKNVRLCVKAGDSWNQPNPEAGDWWEKAAEADAPVAEDAVQSLNILALNDDCLEYICGLLNLRDRVRFARVCQRFRNVFQMVCKREYKRFDVKHLENMTLWDIRDMLRFAGPYIETLEGYIPYTNRERIVEFIGNFSPNVKSLNLEESRMRPDCLRKLLGKLKNVTKLHLNDCSLHDNVILAMTQLRNLEALELTENYELTGRNLDKLPQLKVLSLYGCGNVQSFYLGEACKSMRNLKELDIRRCLRISISFLDALVKHCEHLEVLRMSCPPDLPYERIAHLPALKQAELLSSSLVAGITRTQLFVELGKHKADKLESLKIVSQNYMNFERATLIAQLKQLKTLICANNDKLNDDCLRRFSDLENLEEIVIRNCRAITNAGLMSLVRHCKHLKRVNVQRCNKITAPFVFEAIKFLQKHAPERTEPILFMVYGTGINEYDFVNATEYIAAQKQVKLAFDAFALDADMDNELDIFDMLDEDDDNFTLDDDDFLDEIDEDDDFYVPDDSEDDDMHMAYNLLGRIAPHGFDINDVIW